MKQIFIFIIGSLSIILVSCSKGSKNEDIYYGVSCEKYNLDDAKEVKVEDIFEDVEIIPLLFDGDNYPKGLRGNLITSENIFLHDLNGKLHVFTADGHYLSCSDEKFGQGPEEFQVITGFNWNDETKEIELMTPHFLKCYDTMFNYKSERPLHTRPGTEERKCIFYDEICHIDADRILALPSGVSEDPYRIIIVNTESGKAVGALDYSRDVIGKFGIQPSHFFNMRNGELLFIPKGINNQIYRINRKDLNIEPIIRLDYGRKGLPKEDIEGKEQPRFTMETELEFPVITIPTSSKLFIGVKHGSDVSNGYLVIVDRQTGKLSRLNLKEDGKLVMSLMDYGDEDYMYVIDKKDFLEKEPGLLMDHSEKVDSILSTIEDDTYVVLKYKIKE